jgi:hypothetical protein
MKEAEFKSDGQIRKKNVMSCMIRNLLTFSAQTKDNENTKRQSIEELSTDINILAKNLR